MGGPSFTLKEKRTVLAASCLAIFVNPLAGSMLNLALGAIEADFNCSEHNLGWISSIYFIVSVMALLPASRMADIYGKRRTFMIGAVFGLAGALLSAISPNIYMLYVFRGITGVGMAFISCTCVSLIADVYGPHERGGALGINTASVYIGASVGPTLGGLATDMFGWRSIFLFLVPLIVASFILMFSFKHEFTSTPGESFDSKGSVMYVVGIGILMFGMISLPQIYSVVMIIVGTFIIVGFVLFESKEQFPIFHGELFKNSSFARSIVALFLNYTSSYCVTFFMSRYLQGIGLLTPTEAGVIMMSQPVVQVIFTLIAGKLSDRMDKRILPTLGMAILCVGLVILLLFTEREINYPMIVLSMCIMGLGFGVFSAPNTNAIMSYVSRKDYNHASGLISMFRQMGMMTSIAIATLLISIYLGTDAALNPSNYDTFIHIMRLAWVICICASVIGCIFSWFRGSSPVDD